MYRNDYKYISITQMHLVRIQTLWNFSRQTIRKCWMDRRISEWEKSERVPISLTFWCMLFCLRFFFPAFRLKWNIFRWENCFWRVHFSLSLFHTSFSCDCLLIKRLHGSWNRIQKLFPRFFTHSLTLRRDVWATNFNFKN